MCVSPARRPQFTARAPGVPSHVHRRRGVVCSSPGRQGCHRMCSLGWTGVEYPDVILCFLSKAIRYLHAGGVDMRMPSAILNRVFQSRGGSSGGGGGASRGGRSSGGSRGGSSGGGGGGADYDVIRDLEHLQRESRETSNRYRDHDPEWSLNANQIHDELFFVLGLDVVSVIKI